MAAAMNKLFNDMTEESKSTAPIARFSESVRLRLEKYPKRVRTDIVARIKYKSAPLFHACTKGKLQIVEYLISTCGADPEQKGWHGKSKQMVPPLWCATVSGKFPIVKSLISHGCQVDALSDDKMTSLGVACFKGPAKLDIVEYLLEHGADVNRGFNDGRTCLMEAVRNIKLCRILLQYGADVNITDREGRTALHHAIELQKLDTVKLLLENNADPHIRTKQGDDGLQAAILYGGPRIISPLKSHASYPPERLADFFELSGSRLYQQHEDGNITLLYWRKAIEIRNSNMVDGIPLAKKPPASNLDDDAMEKRLCYGNASEFTTLADLDAIARDPEAIVIQGLLIHERILGKRHKEMSRSIMVAAHFFLEVHDPYQHMMHLWIRALECCDAAIKPSFETAWKVAKGLLDEMDELEIHKREIGIIGPGTEAYQFAEVFPIFKLLTSIFSKAWMSQKNPLLENEQRDEYRRYYHKMVRFVTDIIYSLIKIAKTREEKCEVRKHVKSLIEVNPKSIPENDTLLHSYVTKWFASDMTFSYSNSNFLQYIRVTKLLLSCGARVNARNAKGETPLHKASSRISSDPLNKLLVEHGAHLDTPDANGSTPARAISADSRNTIDVESHMTLRCHAARVIAKHEIPCNYLPASVQEFIDLHRQKVEVE